MFFIVCVWGGGGGVLVAQWLASAWTAWSSVHVRREPEKWPP